MLFEFIKWKLIDLYRELRRIYLKQEKKLHFYGIIGFFGLPGAGKTMGMSFLLKEYREKYGDRIYIATNFNSVYQDFELKTWKQLIKEYDKPLIVAWDEVQNEFNSRAYKDFPVELLTILTQNRKGNGKQILYTAQRFERVDKVFRELTMHCVECRTILGRWGRLKYFHFEDYLDIRNKTDVNLKMKIKPIKTINFVQCDDIRNSYDSYKMLESAKGKEYMSREEISKINLLK